MMMFKVGIKIFNSFDVEAESEDEAEQKVRDLGVHETLEDADYNIASVDRMTEGYQGGVFHEGAVGETGDEMGKGRIEEDPADHAEEKARDESLAEQEKLCSHPSIDGVSFGNIDIHIKGEATIGHIDLGAICLENDGRKYILDVDTYYCEGTVHGQVINADISVNTDDFPVDDDCPYDLTKDDLLGLNNGGTGTLYVTAEADAPPFEVLDIQLWFTADGEYQYVTLEEEE